VDLYSAEVKCLLAWFLHCSFRQFALSWQLIMILQVKL